MQALFAQVQRGALRVVSGGTFALDRAEDAHGALEARTTVGEVFLRPDERGCPEAGVRSSRLRTRRVGQPKVARVARSSPTRRVAA
ncbi:MAG: hypothetical protein KIS78_00175 [Labilithrix sp.]|nr:hypothetical protein [Labilithrix sp.]